MRPGDQIDIWVVEKALGAGGMGSVYRCHNRSAKRILAAIKVLEPTLRHHPGAEERFVREAEILFRLDHPNIVKVRNVRLDGDLPYLEMEFVQGQSLDHLLRRGRVPWREAHAIFAQLTDAIAYLHGQGVRHRDIKPANVLVQSDGSAKLVDFGLAMEADQSRLTQSNMTFGTVSYAPPEWIHPDAMDPEQWDAYAMGVVAWEMLTGEVAFPVSGNGSARQQAMQVILAKQGHPPLDPGPDYHEDVRGLIRELTASDPAARPASMAEVAQRVARLDPSVPRANVTLTPASPDDDRLAPPAADTAINERRVRSEWAKALQDTPVPAEPARRRSPEPATLITIEEHARRRRGPIVAVAAIALGTVALTLSGLALYERLGAVPVPAATRPVDVVVEGLPPGMEVGLWLDDASARSRTSWVWRFGPQVHGAHTLTWSIGRDCAAAPCPDVDCPAWCGLGSMPLNVTAGADTLLLRLPLDPPPTRAVHVVLPPDLGQPARVRLGDAERVSTDGRAVFDAIAPGPHALRVEVGSCGDSDCEGPTTCPPGCAVVTRTTQVAWASDPHEEQVAIAAPAPPRASPGPEPVAAPPPPVAPAPAPQATAGAPVTVARFAAWLVDNPTWQREPARDAGLADDGYLPGWDGATAPAGDGSAAIRGVSWYAAAAYCKERGGLALLEAPPHTWEESARAPYLEWRASDGRAAWRSSDGRSSTMVRLEEANAFTGFRCAR